jgi:RNA polymerase sigma-70 factor (ECF subfamily)
MSTPAEATDCKGHNPLPLETACGQRLCYNCIVEQHQREVYNLSYHILGDRYLAEDATQETFLSAYRAFKGFRGGNLRSWLLRIAANTCKDILRARRARPSESLEALALTPQESSPSQETPEEYALRRELGKAIQEGLGTLPREQRLALALVDIQGLSYEEAAQAMGCSLGTVKSRLSRGRAALRDFLMGKGELLPSRFRQDRGG